MIFGSNHYVPVLKVKQGEKAALHAVGAPLCPGITPFLEIVERKNDKILSAHIDTSFKGLAFAVSHYTRCFIDTREIESDGPTAAQAVFTRAFSEGIIFTPVTGISRTTDVPVVLANSGNGIAIRLTRGEFERGALQQELRTFMAVHRLDYAQVDLIIDLGPVEKMVPYGLRALASGFLNAVPDPLQWRTLTLSACAFPKSMSVVGRNSHSLVERMEWNVWHDDLYANRRVLSRLPSYSDCAIQHTKGVEDFDFRTMQASAAIRYTLDRNWLLIKGVSTRGMPPSQQFPALATQLVRGPLHPNFAGIAHCQGCACMNDAARGASGLGSPGVWRRLGTIHHITTVAHALTALPWP